jgi:hypothetical protein
MLIRELLRFYGGDLLKPPFRCRVFPKAATVQMDFFGNFGKEIRRDTVVRRIFPKLGPLPVREASIPQ